MELTEGGTGTSHGTIREVNLWGSSVVNLVVLNKVQDVWK